RSSEQQEHCRALARRLARATPVGDRARANALRAEREIGSDAKARAGRARLEQRAKKGVVAVGRLDENLGLALAARACFQLLDAPGALPRVPRQVAAKCEPLTLEPGGHQRERDG